MDLKRFYSLNFLGRLLLSAIFINAIPGKITNFSGQVQYLVNRGFPESISILMILAAIALLIFGVLLLFTEKIKLACSLLLIFLVPTTIIFHLVPFQIGYIARNLSLIGGLLVAIDKSN